MAISPYSWALGISLAAVVPCSLEDVIFSVKLPCPLGSGSGLKLHFTNKQILLPLMLDEVELPLKDDVHSGERVLFDSALLLD